MMRVLDDLIFFSFKTLFVLIIILKKKKKGKKKSSVVAQAYNSSHLAGGVRRQKD
jgi:hypothetical protein